ncbi:MAG TPA: hypothetical protein VFN67_21100 [Polyangiales bacterium]|nr:hypothetical protein [Polyangiales bacterium]
MITQGKHSLARFGVCAFVLALAGTSSSACTREEARNSAREAKEGVNHVAAKVKQGAENIKEELPSAAEVKAEVKETGNEVSAALKSAGHEVKQSALELRDGVREGVRDADEKP